MKIEYLSPSTFLKFRNCEHSVYLEKVISVLGKEPERIQSMAMATGTAVDIMIKSALNRRLNKNELLKEEIFSENKACLLLAEELFNLYSRHALPALKEEGIGFGSIDQETEISWIEKQDKSERMWRSILRGMPDLTLKTGEVIDWKCQGMYGRGKVPDKGYSRCFLYNTNNPFNNEDLGPLEDDLYMEQINQSWAIQLYLYNRLLGHKPGEKIRAGIENICVSKDLTVYCASYRNYISPVFQLTIEKEFHIAFDKLIRSTADRSECDYPNPNKYRCIQYNKVCAVANFCKAYNDAMSDKPSDGIRVLRLD